MNFSILEKLGLTEDERVFIRDAQTQVVHEMNQSRIISEIYFIKKLEELTDRTIESNEKLSKSNEKYVKGMLWLTGGLMFVGIMQIITMLIRK